MRSIDRLSSLPDDVICHILSFLPTIESAQTSILAKRYRFLWYFVPSLYFDSGYHDTETSFVYMISRVIFLTKALSINTFHISHDSESEFDSRKFELETWIPTAVERNVQTLFLDLHVDYLDVMCVLPLCIFSCKSLVDLTLDCCAFPSFSSVPITLPSLKSLKLLNIDYAADDALPCLLSCCPVLDKLFISSVVLGNFYNISSPSIKRLSVDLSFNESGGDFCHELRIHAPALKYLKVVDFSSLFISGHMLTSLTEADICYNVLDIDEEEKGVCFLNMIRFLESLSNVSCLKLRWDPVFSIWSKSITRFNNLTQLEFDGNWLILMVLLASAENLEVLIINKVDEDDKVDGEKWMEPKHVPMCVLSRLRTVRLNEEWRGEQVVGYLLKNARVLETIEIYRRRRGRLTSEAKHKALQRISLFERGSVACKVAFRRVKL